jgi:hypothetical protein
MKIYAIFRFGVGTVSGALNTFGAVFLLKLGSFYLEYVYSFIGLMYTRASIQTYQGEIGTSTPNTVALDAAWCRVFVVSPSLNTGPYV